MFYVVVIGVAAAVTYIGVLVVTLADAVDNTEGYSPDNCDSLQTAHHLKQDYNKQQQIITTLFSITS